MPEDDTHLYIPQGRNNKMYHKMIHDLQKITLVQHKNLLGFALSQSCCCVFTTTQAILCS